MQRRYSRRASVEDDASRYELSSPSIGRARDGEILVEVVRQISRERYPPGLRRYGLQGTDLTVDDPRHPSAPAPPMRARARVQVGERKESRQLRTLRLFHSATIAGTFARREPRSLRVLSPEAALTRAAGGFALFCPGHAHIAWCMLRSIRE